MNTIPARGDVFRSCSTNKQGCRHCLYSSEDSVSDEDSGNFRTRFCSYLVSTDVLSEWSPHLSALHRPLTMT